MFKKSIICLILLFSSTFAQTSNQQTQFLTGNPSVDFFGSSLMDNYSPSMNDKLEVLQWEDMELADEKSPWLAALLSLAVPGTGEVYTESYVKAALFFAVEATSWSIAYSYNKKGNNQTSIYQDYANQHWSAVRYVNWTLDRLNALNPQSPNLKTKDEYSDLIYGDIDQPLPGDCGPPFSCINWRELNAMERDIAMGYSNGFTHGLPYFGEQQYYELIGKYDQFSRGWDDSDPNDPLENQVPIQSTSKRFFEYAKMRADANAQYDVASTWVSVAVINHVLSALDAYWSATQYNSSLHAEVKTKIIPTQLGMIPIPELKVRYEF
jgi:hypothetical protein